MSRVMELRHPKRTKEDKKITLKNAKEREGREANGV